MKLFKSIATSFWFKPGLYALMTRLSLTFFGFLTFFFLVRMWSPTEFGFWVLFISVVNVMEAIRTAFIYTPMIRYLNSSEAEQHHEIRGASFFLNTLTAVIIILILLILSQTAELIWESHELKNMFLINIVAVICYTWSSHYCFMQQAANQFKGTFFNTLTQKGLLFFFILIMWLSGRQFSLTTLSIVLSASYVLSMFVAFRYSRKNVNRHIYLLSGRISELFHYGKFTFSTNLGTLIDNGINEWLLGSLTFSSQVAMYNTSVRLSNIFEIPLGAGGSIFYPEMVRRAEEKGLHAAKSFFERTMGFFLLIILPLVFLLYFFAEPVILFVAGKEYIEAVPVLKVMVFLGVFAPFLRQFSVLMNAIGKARLNFYIILISTGIFSLLKYILIENFGLMGAAYSMIISYGLLAIILMQVLSRQMHVEYREVGRFMIAYIKTGLHYLKLIYHSLFH